MCENSRHNQTIRKKQLPEPYYNMYNRPCEEYNLLPSCLDYIHFTSILYSLLYVFLVYKHPRGTKTSIKTR